MACLLGDDAAWTTGHTMVRDGGTTLVDGSTSGGRGTDWHGGPVSRRLTSSTRHPAEDPPAAYAPGTPHPGTSLDEETR